MNSQKKRVDKKIGKKALIVLGSLCFMCIMCIIGLYFLHKEDSQVATVNGEPISRLEFTRVLKEKSSQIYSYFHTRYQAEDNKDFWITEFDGQVPIEMAREQALEDCIKVKLQQMMARDKGLLVDISYEGFLDRLHDENKNREKAVKNNEVIYGPIRFGETEFFNYTFSNMILELKDKLAEKELTVEDVFLEDYYHEVKEKIYKKHDKIMINKMSIHFNNLTKDKAITILTEIQQGIKDKNMTVEEIKHYNENIQLEALVIDETNAREYAKSKEMIYDVLRELSKGDVTDIMEDNNQVFILSCTDRQEQGYYDFDQVKDHVRQLYVDQAYDKLVKQMMEEAVVEIDEKALKNIWVR